MVTGALSDSVGQAGPSGRPGRTGSCCDRPISPPAGAIAGPGLRRQGLPAGDGPGTGAGLRGVGDGRNTQRGHIAVLFPEAERPICSLNDDGIRPASPALLAGNPLQHGDGLDFDQELRCGER